MGIRLSTRSDGYISTQGYGQPSVSHTRSSLIDEVEQPEVLRPPNASILYRNTYWEGEAGLGGIQHQQEFFEYCMAWALKMYSDRRLSGIWVPTYLRSDWWLLAIEDAGVAASRMSIRILVSISLDRTISSCSAAAWKCAYLTSTKHCIV